ncbi:MAG TPA: FliM/FliN family flagellar motor switch protein [Bryobacteraceae bacterium]|nr:FliM/FliN family flagellar motor switch protein [Bryobacteraceae bacterium]
MTTNEGLSWLLQTWTEGLNSALTEMGIPGFTVQEHGEETELGDPDPLWFGQLFDGQNEPCIWIGAGKPAWQHLGSYLQIQAGIEQPDEAAALDTYRELLAKSLTTLASALSAQLGRDITCTETTDEPPASSESGAARVVELLTGDDIPARVCVVCSQGLLQLLDQEGAAVHGAHAAEPGNPAVDFESLLDLDMPIVVALGSARIDLQRTLNLTEGAVIRLSRAPSDLMQLVINGRCVAQGELVAARGQYAIRIHQVSSAERLAQVQSISGSEQKSLPS